VRIGWAITGFVLALPWLDYAHNWIDYKDARYGEGCDLAQAARQRGYVPTTPRP
jgi:hypothetical protein